MAQSGIVVEDLVVQKFDAIKLKKPKDTNPAKYVIFKVSDDKSKVEFEEDLCEDDSNSKDENCERCWKELIAKLDDAKPRYIVYDLNNKYKEGRDLKKLIFIAWCSDSCKVGDKMIFASTKDALTKKLNGIHLKIQASDKGDLTYSEVLTEAQKGK